MNGTLFSIGLFVVGFTLMILMPAGQKRSWKELGRKPPSGDSIVLMMRFMGLFLIVFSSLIFMGILNVESILPPQPPAQ